MGKVVKVSGPLVVATGMADANMSDVVRVGPERLIGEILTMNGDSASIQVYEETSGLGPGTEVVTTGSPMSVELGPGMIENIYDGIQRPLEKIMEKVRGNNLPRGVEVPPIDPEKLWEFTPVVKAGDNPNKAFLMTVLEQCATADDAAFFAGLLGDDYLGNFAARALASIGGTEDTVLELMQNQNANGLSKALLAQIASYKPHFHGAEDILVEWAKTATPEEAVHIYNALALSGGEKSAKVLGAAAKAAGYTFEPTDAYGAYLILLNGHLMKHSPKAVESAAKQMMKFDKSNVRLAGLDLLVQLKGEAVTPLVVKALSDKCREYRYGAMRAAEAFADDKTYAAVAAALPRLNDAAKIDVINWLGANHAASQIDAVCTQISNPDADVAAEAIEAASRIGGEKALEAILAKAATLEKTDKELLTAAYNSLLSFNGKINDGIVEVLDGNEMIKSIAYGILGQRRIPEAAAKIMAAAQAGDEAAIAVLPNVVTEKNFDAVCDMLVAGKNVSPAVNKAIQDKPAAEQVKLIDATPIGINVRSTVATYSGVLDDLRRLYANTEDGKRLGYKTADFSYNTGSLRCPTCDGTGQITMDVQFLPDVDIPCPDCGASRYGKEAEKVLRYPKGGGEGLSLPALMGLTITEALEKLADVKKVRERLEILSGLGLGYLTLGEATPALSGGEAQRLKLAAEMGRAQEDALFVFDEPTIGLHPLDVRALLEVFQKLIDSGATVLVIEHDLDMIANADYVVDMGPGGGTAGGRIVAAGTPEELRANPESVTGRYL